MTPESFSSLAYNQIWTLIGAGTILGFIVRPYQKKLTHATSALQQVTSELQALRDARVVETLNTHGAAIEELKKQRMERIQQRVQEHQAIEQTVRKIIEQSDQEARAGRKHLHEDIGALRVQCAGLDKDLKNVTGWLEKLDDRLDQKTTELFTATGNIAGRQGN